MMAADPRREHVSIQDYLRMSANSDEKIEYHAGQIRALAGGTAAHAKIALNIAMLIHQELGNSGPCDVYSSDMKVKLAEDRYVFPDVTVSCDLRDGRDDSKLLQSPRVVIEVLSDSTKRFDTTEKLRLYQNHVSICEYMLVHQAHQFVEIYTRDEESNAWSYKSYRSDAEIVTLSSIDVEIAFPGIYARTSVPK